MKRQVVNAAALLVVGMTGSAFADAPVRTMNEIDVTFPEGMVSDTCGIPVFLTIRGTFKVTLFRDRDGNVVREIDTGPGVKLTYANDSGQSISFPGAGVLHTDYSSGVTPGSPVTLVFTGNTGPFTGLAGPGTGRLVLAGDVVEVVDGVPFTEFTELISASGNFSTQTERICAALTG